MLREFNSSSAKEKGERLKSLRLGQGHSVFEFSKLTGIPEPTLYSWEKGRSPLSLKGAKKILRVIEPHSEKRLLFWLMNGEKEILSTLKKNVLDDVLMIQDINYFIQSRDNAVVMIILDDLMLPFLSPGDYVGGIKKTGEAIAKLEGKWCVVEIEDGTLFTRILEKSPDAGLFNLKTTLSEDDTLYNQTLNFAAPISWIRKRDISF